MMLSLIVNSTSIAHHQCPSSCYVSSIFSRISHLKFRKKSIMSKKASTFNCFKYIVGKEKVKFDGLVLGRGDVNVRGSSMCCRCMSSGSDKNLEEMILEFMEKSNRPEKFPTKKELISAGRFDLAEAISRRGGWFSLGWELEDEKSDIVKVEESEIEEMECDVEEFRRRVEDCGWSDSPRENEINASVSGKDFAEPASSLPTPSSSGRPLEMITEKESGIEGILSRLEKERNLTLGINLGKYENGSQVSNMLDGVQKQCQTSTNVDWVDPGKSGNLIFSSAKRGISCDSDSHHDHYTKPDLWRACRIQHAGFHNTEFEGAEILYDQGKRERAARDGEIVSMMNAEASANHCQGQIHGLLQHLESKLSSAPHFIRSSGKRSYLTEAMGSSYSELQKLSDVSEFQENKIMSGQERLWSIRTKLAVLEGKVVRAIIEAQEMVEEKQRRVERAQKALRLLCEAKIFLPSSASEVFLVGSYDGWTTQRRMEKSSSGIFSASLVLYPGRYEIKFIVDGIWWVDPLRPIVHKNGFQNNLLVITQCDTQN
ncbi:hypothetical protein Leryth_021105 [Lithospermum erythrorhizon]|nr:hypothetical protein Leryth_021105 [Lithospermum erythrorhizon]